MGRRKIEIQPITHERNRSVTFLKRKNGLFKKAYELGVLCSVDVAVIIFEERPGHNLKLHQYSSGDVQGIVQRHIRFDGEKDVRGPGDFSGVASKLGDIDDDDADDADDPRLGAGGGTFGGKKEGVKSESASVRAMPPPSSTTSGDISMDLEYHLRRSALAAQISSSSSSTPTPHPTSSLPISIERLAPAPHTHTHDTPISHHLSNKKIRLSPDTLLRRSGSSDDLSPGPSYYHPSYRHPPLSHPHPSFFPTGISTIPPFDSRSQLPLPLPLQLPLPLRSVYASRPPHIDSMQHPEALYQLLRQQQQRQEEQAQAQISPELLSALLNDRMQQGGTGTGAGLGSFQGLDWPVHGSSSQQERDSGEDHILESQDANWLNFLSSNASGPPPTSPPETRTSWERDHMDGSGDVGGRSSKKRPRDDKDDKAEGGEGEDGGGGGGGEGGEVGKGDEDEDPLKAVGVGVGDGDGDEDGDGDMKDELEGT